MTVKCKIGIETHKQKDVIEEVCRDIRLNDKTFRYSFFKTRYGDWEWILTIMCKDKDQAHQRGMWMHNNVPEDEPIGLMYWIEED